MKIRDKKFYDTFIDKIREKMEKKWPEIEKRNFKRVNEQEIRFWIKDDPTRTSFYPRLLSLFKTSFPKIKEEKIWYEISKDGNSLKIMPEEGGIELFLIKRKDFEKIYS